MVHKRTKHDYEAMWTEFFTWPWVTVNEYYRERYGKKASGSVAWRLAGWNDKKVKMKKDSIQEAMNEAKDEIKWAIRPQVAELTEKLNNVLKLVDIKIKGMYDNAFEVVYDKWGDVIYKTNGAWEFILDASGARVPMTRVSNKISATEINRLYDMVKTELWEPAKIHNSRLTDGDGWNLPTITGVEVEIITRAVEKRTTIKKT